MSKARTNDESLDEVVGAIHKELSRTTPFKFDKWGTLLNPNVLKDAWASGDVDDENYVSAVSIDVAQLQDGSWDCEVSLYEDPNLTLYFGSGEERRPEIEKLLMLDSRAIEEVAITFAKNGWLEDN
jgi:hypothetical protein